MKRVIPILFIFLLIITLSSTVFADEVQEAVKGMIQGDGAGASQLISVGGKVLGMAQMIGTAVATVMLLILGAKYMYTSPNEKATIKNKLMPYLIGAIILYGCVGILQIIKMFASGID